MSMLALVPCGQVQVTDVLRVYTLPHPPLPCPPLPLRIDPAIVKSVCRAWEITDAEAGRDLT